MNPDTLKELLEAKQNRRVRLINLSINEKVDIIEKMRDLGRIMIEARKSLPVREDKQPKSDH